MVCVSEHRTSTQGRGRGDSAHTHDADEDVVHPGGSGVWAAEGACPSETSGPLDISGTIIWHLRSSDSATRFIPRTMGITPTKMVTSILPLRPPCVMAVHQHVKWHGGQQSCRSRGAPEFIPKSTCCYVQSPSRVFSSGVHSDGLLGHAIVAEECHHCSEYHRTTSPHVKMVA